MNTVSRKQTMVWGGLLIIFGGLLLIQVYTPLNEWIWAGVLTLCGLAILGFYFTDRSEWSLLIPAYVMFAIAGLLVFVTTGFLRDEMVAFYVLTVIGLPFLYVFLRNRENWWALIPAYVLFAVGLMVALIGVGILDDLLIPAYVMFAIAIPFIVVYVRNPKNWWALIPGGVMAIIGLSFFAASSALQFIGPAVLILIGVWILARQFLRKEPDQPKLEE